MTVIDLHDREPPDEEAAWTRAKRAMLEAASELDEFAMWRRRGAIDAAKAVERISIVVTDVHDAIADLCAAIDDDEDGGPDSGSAVDVAC